MKKKIFILLLSFILLFAFPLSVSASEDTPDYIDIDEHILDDLTLLALFYGAFIDPNVSPWEIMYDYQKNHIENQNNFFIYDEQANKIMIRSSYKQDNSDSVLYPSEFLDEWKTMIVSYYGEKFGLTDNTASAQYKIENQGNGFVPRGYTVSHEANYITYMNSTFKCAYNYNEFGKTVNQLTLADNKRVYGVKRISNDSYSNLGYNITFYEYNLNNNSNTSYSMPRVSRKIDNKTGLVSNTSVSNSAGVPTFTYYWSFNFPIFDTIADGQAWAKGQIDTPNSNKNRINYFKASNFSQPTKTLVLKSNPDINAKQLNDEYYNIINNYITEYTITNNSYPSDEEIQNVIDENQILLNVTLENYIVNDSGGSDSGGSSSGGSCACPDYTGDFEELQTTIDDIYKKLSDFYEAYSNQDLPEYPEIDLTNIENALSALEELLRSERQDHVKALEDIYDKLDEILEEFRFLVDQPGNEIPDYTEPITDIKTVLDEIKALQDSNYEYLNTELDKIYKMIDYNNQLHESFLEKLSDKLDAIIHWLKKIYRVNVVDTIADIVTALNETFENVMNFSDLANRSNETAELAKTKFPFCLPFDLVSTLSMFLVESKVPSFDIPFSFSAFGVEFNQNLTINVGQFEKLANFTRSLLTIVFVFGLIMLSMKIFKGDSDD